MIVIHSVILILELEPGGGNLAIRLHYLHLCSAPYHRAAAENSSLVRNLDKQSFQGCRGAREELSAAARWYGAEHLHYLHLCSAPYHWPPSFFFMRCIRE